MSELITGIYPQPNFPREDLTPENADMLELMLGNRAILHEAHTIIETTSFLYQVGHKVITRRAEPVFESAPQQAAINHGVTSFEAIAALVVGCTQVSDTVPIHYAATNLLHLAPRDFDNRAEEALADLKQHAPNTAEVVVVSARRFHGPLTNYALLGAALSRQFGLSVA